MKNNSIIYQNKAFLWVALGTGLALLIPYLAMLFDWRMIDPGSQVPESINWSVGDFVMMGILLFSSGSGFVLTARKVNRKYWPMVGLAFGLGLVWIWAELAVGIFTNWGS